MQTRGICPKLISETLGRHSRRQAINAHQHRWFGQVGLVPGEPLSPVSERTTERKQDPDSVSNAKRIPYTIFNIFKVFWTPFEISLCLQLGVPADGVLSLLRQNHLFCHACHTTFSMFNVFTREATKK